MVFPEGLNARVRQWRTGEAVHSLQRLVYALSKNGLAVNLLSGKRFACVKWRQRYRS